MVVIGALLFYRDTTESDNHCGVLDTRSCTDPLGTTSIQP